MTSYRKDFPILDQQVNGAPLVYLDNAATSQKPQAVIDALSDYYRRYNANVHRAVHALSDQATVAFEQARDRVREFINAEHRHEIIFTRGTTESINLVANCYTGLLKPGDEILISHMEHHSNIVPWQMLASRTEAVLKACDVNSQGDIDIDSFATLLSDKTRIVAIGHVSNALGTVNPLQQIIEQAHSAGAVVVVDGAQAVPHFAVDVVALDCDYYAFSGHKMYGPTGIGVLYGKEKLLDVLPPWQGGGEMIETVTIDGVRDLAGNTIAVPVMTTFTTEPGVDLFRPSVSGHNPLSNATGVGTNAVVTVAFNERVNPLTVNPSTFTMRENVQFTSISGTVVVALDQRSATFTPDELLPPFTSHTWTISS